MCGHSYGGMPVTGAGDRLAQLVALVIYIDALVPRHGTNPLQPLPSRFTSTARSTARSARSSSAPATSWAATWAATRSLQWPHELVVRGGSIGSSSPRTTRS
jgi:pimeloyl-ACP methyl ester carboxylesterase